MTDEMVPCPRCAEWPRITGTKTNVWQEWCYLCNREKGIPAALAVEYALVWDVWYTFATSSIDACDILRAKYGLPTSDMVKFVPLS